MSLSADHYVKQIDPVIDLTRPVKLRIEEGAETIQVTRYPAASISLQNIQFNNINPNNADTIVDRKVFVKAAFRLRFTGTGAINGAYLFNSTGASGTGDLQGGTDALRAFPLSQITSSLAVKINSQTFVQNINQYIEPLMRYSNYRDVGEEDWSMTPTMQDQYMQYADSLTYGTAKNALGQYGENGYQTPRGGFAGLNIVQQNIVGQPAGTPSTGVGDLMEAFVDVQVAEPLFISPLAFGKRSHRGFLGVNTMSVTLNIDSNYANRIWSHDAASSGITLNSIELDYAVSTPGFVSRPEIAFTYYTPRMSQMMPKDNLYPYHDITSYTFDFNGPIQPQESQLLSINNIQLDSVPKRVYIFARKLENAKTFNDADAYARIENINFTFSNHNGLLSGANEEQLYKLSIENGLKSSWSQWSKYNGSVLCLDFSKNISLDHNNVVGKNGSYQLQYRLGIKNLFDVATTFTVHTVVVSDGYINIMDQSVDRHSNLGDVDQVYDSPLIHVIDWESAEMFYGAGIADTLKKYTKKALKTAADVGLSAAKKFGPDVANYTLSHIPGIGPELGQAAEFALRALASGEMTPDQYAKKMNKLFGSGVVGGKAVTKGGMKKALKRY